MPLSKDQARDDVERAVGDAVRRCRSNLDAMGFAERDVLDVLIGGTQAAIRDHEERLDEIDHDEDDEADGRAWYDEDDPE